MTTDVFTAARSSRLAMRSIGAVVAGFATVAVLSIVADGALRAAGLYPDEAAASLQDGLFALALGYRALFGVAAGYVAGKLAPHRPLMHAAILGGIGTVLSIGGAVALWEAGPHWYAIGVALACIPTALFGARLARPAR